MLPHPARRESRCGTASRTAFAAPAGVHAWLSNSSFADPRRQRLPALSGIARWRAHLVAAELAPQARLPSSAAIGKSAPAPCSRDSCTAAPAARHSRPRRVTNCVMPWRRGVITDLAALESGPVLGIRADQSGERAHLGTSGSNGAARGGVAEFHGSTFVVVQLSLQSRETCCDAVRFALQFSNEAKNNKSGSTGLRRRERRI
jgi:hypothetical protein